MTWLPDAAVDRLRDVADFPVPRTDRYAIDTPIARGGMGTVYRARDRELGRTVAVKVMSATIENSDLAERMRQEARILAQLEHPGIVPVYDVGVLEDGRLFYVMKLVHGPRLDQHAASRPLAERLRLFTRICEPVAFAHARGVVHRDLKPENVMVGPFGEVLVLDWGAAQIIADCKLQIEDCGSANAEYIVGTQGYMAPEQKRGALVDGRADVYALGGILHFLLTGAPPDSAPHGVFKGPRAVQAICRKARADRADERYRDVTALSADVERYLAGDRVSALAESRLDQLARFIRKNRVAIAIIVTYLVLRYLIAWISTTT